MPKITVLPHHEICPQGIEVELAAGENLCKALIEKGIKSKIIITLEGKNGEIRKCVGLPG